jgi:protease-4
MKKYRENHGVRAIVLRIDSPGGGVVASQEMYEEVRATRDAGKPVIVSMGSLAASGGYYVSCGGSRLVANRGTLTGSIGVISEFLQYGDALRKLGIDITTIKSGKLKDSGTPMRKMTADEQRYFQTLMDDVHRQFIAVVETERHLDHDAAAEIADGRVFTGEEALKLGLVDTLGTYEDAIRIAASMVGISGEPSLMKERKRRGWWEPFLGEADATLKELKQEFLERPILSYRYAGQP